MKNKYTVVTKNTEHNILEVLHVEVEHLKDALECDSAILKEQTAVIESLKEQVTTQHDVLMRKERDIESPAYVDDRAAHLDSIIGEATP